MNEINQLWFLAIFAGLVAAVAFGFAGLILCFYFLLRGPLAGLEFPALFVPKQPKIFDPHIEFFEEDDKEMFPNE